LLIGDGDGDGIDFVVANVQFPYVLIVDDEERGEKGRRKERTNET
jgi:hypothetical protein